MSDFDAVKERIRDAVDIVDLVGQYVPLRRQGSMYAGRCPWHDDSRPSLQVNPQRQSFKCWVCDIGGDIFSFVMKIENVDFPEALEILSEKTGIALPKRSKPGISAALSSKNDGGMENEYAGQNEQEEPPEKKTLLKAADYIAGLYHNALLTLPEAESARQYLNSRKLDADAVKKFRIGYAPLAADFLRSKADNKISRLKVLEAVGNLKNGKDFFAGRLIFPICDDRGNTAAFGGRLIPNSPLSRDDWHKDRKYLNTSETAIFSKHKFLYGLNVAKQRIKETRHVLIMEGYTDCITAHQFGFTYAVAVLGTALGREHIRLLNRMGAEKMILMLDGDKAGQSKAESDNVLTDFISQGADMSVLILPENLDPCEYLEKYGAEALETLLKTQSVNALDHIFQIKTRGIDLKTDIIASSKALDAVLGIIAHSPPQTSFPDKPNDSIAFRIEKTLQTLSVRFNVPLEEIKKRLHHLTLIRKQRSEVYMQNAPDNRQQPTDNDDNLPLETDALEREMLELWLAASAAIPQFGDTVPLERCRYPVTKTIYAKCRALAADGKVPTVQNLLTVFDSPAMKNFLLTLADNGEEKLRSRIPYGSDEQCRRKVLDEVVLEITAAFDRRDSQQTQLQELNRIKDSRLSPEDKTTQLLRIQQELLKKQKN
ncbi:MAG: DNA primase [Planctomycetaceae bacterium]|nr:DNA primase [Planctomycetaceae bacterium]